MPTRALTAADTGTGVDAFGSLDAGVSNSATDAGTFTETATVTVAVTSADVGSGVDAATLAAAVTATDTGAGVDGAAVAAAVTAADVVQGLDTATPPAVTVAAADTGAGVDVAVVAAALTSSDTATAVDLAALSVNLSAFDLLTLSDQVAARALVAAEFAAWVEAVTELTQQGDSWWEYGPPLAPLTMVGEWDGASLTPLTVDWG